MIIENNIQFCTQKRDNLIQTIDKLIKSNRKNKALLSLKYDDIANRINKDLLNPFRENPYSKPLDSFA